MIEEYKYYELINPSNLFLNTNEVEEFICDCENTKELEAFLSICESEELYDYCKIISNKIQTLQ